MVNGWPARGQHLIDKDLSLGQIPWVDGAFNLYKSLDMSALPLKSQMEHLGYFAEEDKNLSLEIVKLIFMPFIYSWLGLGSTVDVNKP